LRSVEPVAAVDGLPELYFDVVDVEVPENAKDVVGGVVSVLALERARTDTDPNHHQAQRRLAVVLVGEANAIHGGPLQPQRFEQVPDLGAHLCLPDVVKVVAIDTACLLEPPVRLEPLGHDKGPGLAARAEYELGSGRDACIVVIGFFSETK